MTRDAAFYFANLAADVARCVNAAQQNNTIRYEDSLSRAYRTLEQLHKTARPEAYEEGLLMLRGLYFARETAEALASFQSGLDSIASTFSRRFV
jgi:hypothetical protein